MPTPSPEVIKMLADIQTEIRAGKSFLNTPESQAHNAASDRAIRIIELYKEGIGLLQVIRKG